MVMHLTRSLASNLQPGPDTPVLITAKNAVIRELLLCLKKKRNQIHLLRAYPQSPILSRLSEGKSITNKPISSSCG